MFTVDPKLEDPTITPEMLEHFIKRTDYHIGLVRKYSDKIADMDFFKDNPLALKDLLGEASIHDAGKWKMPELIPYIHLTWSYKMKREGGSYKMRPAIKDAIHVATFSHICLHAHHPEFWDDKVKPEHLNSQDRDKPSGYMVDGTTMPLGFIGSMMADWLAMSEEKKTDIFKWIEINVNKRWKFTEEQVALINLIANAIKVEV